MPRKNITTKPLTAFSETAAKLSFAAAALFLMLLAALHLIKPEFDPSWRMISEYEIGRYGWIMQGAFIVLAVSCVALVAAIQSQVRTIGGCIGLALLLLSATGMTIAAFGVSDPITTSPGQLSAHGRMHGLGAEIGIPSFPIAALLISLSLGTTKAWSRARRSLLWVAHLSWISVLIMLGFVIVLLPRNGGKFGPDVFIGWPNRFLIVTYSAWLMAVAWRAIELRHPAPQGESGKENRSADTQSSAESDWLDGVPASASGHKH